MSDDADEPGAENYPRASHSLIALLTPAAISGASALNLGAGRCSKPPAKSLILLPRKAFYFIELRCRKSYLTP